MPNPYQARAVRDTAPSFPDARLRRLGMTDEEVAEALDAWNELTDDERAFTATSFAAMTDEEVTTALEADRVTQAEAVASEQSREEEPDEPVALTGVVAPVAQGGPGEATAAAGTPVAASSPSKQKSKTKGKR